MLFDPEDDPFLDFQAILEEGNKDRLDRIRWESYQQALSETMVTLESWMADFFRTFQEAGAQGAVVGLDEAYKHFKEVQPAPIIAADRASIFAFLDRQFLDYLPVALKKEDLPVPPAVAGVELEYLSKVQIATSPEYLRHFQNRPADFGLVVLMLAKALKLEIHAKFLAQCRQARGKQLEQAAAPGRDEVAKNSSAFSARKRR